MKKVVVGGVIAGVGVLLNGCGGEKTSSGGTQGHETRETQQLAIKIDGSSTVYPITAGVAEEFSKHNKNVKVSVAISGTGGGFKRFCIGETDISNASRPITPAEAQKAKENNVDYVEFLVGYDGLAIVVHPQNDWVKGLKIEELKKMWEPEAENKIKRWKQVNPQFPDYPLNLYGAGTNSGTFDYFTEAVVGKARASRADYQASEDDNVLVEGIARDKYALGYFGLAYYMENKEKLKIVPIWNEEKKEYIYPDDETVVNKIYPLSRPLFIYVNKNLLKHPGGVDFVRFYLENCQRIAKDVGYVPISDNEARKNIELLEETLKSIGSVSAKK